jgi:magnesium transporter
MTPECITLRETMTVDDALAKIRKQALDKETIYTCYVTDNNKTLLGIVSARDILTHNPDEKISDFMQENFIFASSLDDKEEVANLLSKYDLLAIPIVDKENRILGIVTIDDAIDVITEEATEDIAKMAGAVPNEKPYLKTKSISLWLNRVPWLIFLLLSATFTGLIISKNESLLSNGIYGIILTSCIPMIMGTGGNAGGQASATIIRGIALDEIEFKDTLKVLFKELCVGLIMGLTLGITCFGKIMLIDGMLLHTVGVSTQSAFVISISLAVTIILSKLVGSILPLIAKKCKLDPAVMASPFITTIIDILSLLIYCGFSMLLLG